jgi:hypothetical protein
MLRYLASAHPGAKWLSQKAKWLCHLLRSSLARSLVAQPSNYKWLSHLYKYMVSEGTSLLRCFVSSYSISSSLRGMAMLYAQMKILGP